MSRPTRTARRQRTGARPGAGRGLPEPHPAPLRGTRRWRARPRPPTPGKACCASPMPATRLSRPCSRSRSADEAAALLEGLAAPATRPADRRHGHGAAIAGPGARLAWCCAIRARRHGAGGAAAPRTSTGASTNSTASSRAWWPSVAAQYLQKFDPAHDKGWIAESEGERVGAVFVVRRSKTVAQLRCLILTPAARGRGLGNRLSMSASLSPAARGGRKLTSRGPRAARAIYRLRGFQIVNTEPYAAFGQKMVSEVWELKL